MASTYPLEVVQAARWAKANPDVKGDAALKKVENETWDVSVKSLATFPNVLEMMNEKLDWTQKLGDAFIGQQKDVLAEVQRLRQMAKNSGNLESNQRQVVRSEAQAIVIEPAQPQVIYVPAYNPTVVYGTWPYPAYPPYYYPGVAMRYPGSALVRGFAWGVGFAAAGAMFGSCNWWRGDVNINVNRATNIDRNYTHNNVNAGGSWQHNPQHRGDTAYRDQASRERYGNKQADSARSDFRGRDGTGDRGERDGGGDRGDRAGAGDCDGPGGAGGGRASSSALDGVSSGNRDAARGHSSAGSSKLAGSGSSASAGGRSHSGGSSAGAGGSGSRSFSGGGGGGGRAGGAEENTI